MKRTVDWMEEYACAGLLAILGACVLIPVYIVALPFAVVGWCACKLIDKFARRS